MEPRATFRALAVLLVLLALIAFTGREAPEVARPLLPGFSLNDVTAVVLRQGSREVRLERTGGEWRVAAPSISACRGDLVADFLARLSLSQRYLELTDANPADPAYGLGESGAGTRNGYRILAGSSEIALAVGRKSPNGAGRYCLVEGDPDHRPGVIVTGLEVNGLLEIGFDRLRERRVAPFDPADIEMIRIDHVTGGDRAVETLALAREPGGRWGLATGNRRGQADRDRVERLLADLAGHESVVWSPAERPAEYARCGAAAAAWAVTLADRSGAPRAGFRIAPLENTATVYAARSGEVFTLTADLRDRLTAGFGAFRVLTPLDFDLRQAARLRLVPPGTAPVELLRVADRWERSAPGRAPAIFQAASVEAALLALSVPAVTGYPDPTTDPRCPALKIDPGLRVEIRRGDTTTDEVLLLSRDPAAFPALYSAAVDEFYAVAPEDLAAALQAFDDLLR